MVLRCVGWHGEAPRCCQAEARRRAAIRRYPWALAQDGWPPPRFIPLEPSRGLSKTGNGNKKATILGLGKFPGRFMAGDQVRKEQGAIQEPLPYQVPGRDARSPTMGVLLASSCTKPRLAGTSHLLAGHAWPASVLASPAASPYSAVRPWAELPLCLLPLKPAG